LLCIHSMTLNPFRLLQRMFKNMVCLYSDEKLFTQPLEEKNKVLSYPKNIEKEMLHFYT